MTQARYAADVIVHSVRCRSRALHKQCVSVRGFLIPTLHLRVLCVCVCVCVCVHWYLLFICVSDNLTVYPLL